MIIEPNYDKVHAFFAKKPTLGFGGCTQCTCNNCRCSGSCKTYAETDTELYLYQ